LKVKTKELQELFTIFRNEWQNAVLINPFYIFKKCSDSEHIFEDVAELFLESTDYITSSEYYIRETEKAFIVVCFSYLHFFAPEEENNLSMLIELLKADMVDEKYDEDKESDFQRLMEINKENELKNSHIVDKFYDLYQKKSRYIRQQALQSLALRLYPLYLFHNYDNNLEEYIIVGLDEPFLLQLTVSLLHNCYLEPEEPFSLIGNKMLISYVFSCLKYCFDNGIHSRKKILNFLNDNKVKANYEVKSDDKSINNQDVIKYWERCEHKQMSQEDMRRINELKNFYDGCG